MRASQKQSATSAGSAPSRPVSAERAKPAEDNRADDLLLDDDDEALIDDGRGAEDLDEFNDDGDASPGDRRRDPLRRTI